MPPRLSLQTAGPLFLTCLTPELLPHRPLTICKPVLGRSTTARVVLRETIGVEPSDAILVAVPISVAKTIDSYGELKMVCDGILRTQVRDGVES